MPRSFRLLPPVFVLLLAAVAVACNVPVFRYALERWNPDAYEVTLFHDQPLTTGQAAMLKTIRSQVTGKERQLDSFYISQVDVTAPMDDRSRALLEAIKPATFPHLVVQFPHARPADTHAYSGPLTADIAATVADSPMRRAVVKKILEGESVVWLLVESGDQAKDDEAAALLAVELARLSKELVLPQLDATDTKFHDPDAGPKLRMSFTMLRMSRIDAKEKMFLRLLENWDGKDLDRSQPLAFAIFGRGRVLPPLSGKYLNAKFLREANEFLVGRCSCQMKEENPGWDLLMPVDWESVMRGQVSLTDAMPALTSAQAVVEQNEAIKKKVDPALVSVETIKPIAEPIPPASAAGSTMLRNVVTLVIVAFLCIVGVSIRMRIRRAE